MRIRRNSEFANLHYLKNICVLNQNPRDIFDPYIQSQSQNKGKNDDFCGLASFGKTVKDLLSELYPTEEGRINQKMSRLHTAPLLMPADSTVEWKQTEGSQYFEVHVQLLENSSTCYGTSERSEKKVNRGLKRKKPEDSSPGDGILYYAGFPGLRRKRGPVLVSEAAPPLNNVNESG